MRAIALLLVALLANAADDVDEGAHHHHHKHHHKKGHHDASAGGQQDINVSTAVDMAHDAVAQHVATAVKAVAAVSGVASQVAAAAVEAAQSRSVAHSDNIATVTGSKKGALAADLNKKVNETVTEKLMQKFPSLELEDPPPAAASSAPKAEQPVQLAAGPSASVAVDLGYPAAAAPGVEPCGPDIDIDTDMPYGELEPFGREDTAQELTESSITESDEMVDQLERAEVAEEKRAVFRALTRLRGAAITSFDGVARSQTGNIDEYNKVHKWRMTHPLRHLADEESDISKWAFPDNADF